MPGGPSKDRCEDRASRSRVRPNSGEGAVVVLELWKYRQRQRGQRQEQSLGNPRIQRFDPAVSRVRLRLQRTNFEAHHIATPRAIIPTDPQRRGTEAHKALQEAAPSSNFYDRHHQSFSQEASNRAFSQSGPAAHKSGHDREPEKSA